MSDPQQRHVSSPQSKEMADESMVRNLSAQAEAIWPQEAPIFARHPLGSARVLDLGCGTGEITARLAEAYPGATFVGVDLEEAHLERARARCAPFGDRVRFEHGDALALHYPDATFDLVVCRHVLQAVPDAARVTAEIHRVLRPGGRAHLLAEDYGMLLAHPMERDSDDFWQKIPPVFGASVGCEMHIGRKMLPILHDLGMRDIRVDYVVVDTLRVPRNTFARIWEAWRDGYTDSISGLGIHTRGEIEQWWERMLACVRDPRGYALWQVPVWTAMK
jgi:ubiquinone/menaquinone biosynthesis C-methylase UbiE